LLTSLSEQKLKLSTVPKREKKVACKEKGDERLTQDKITRTIFVLQGFYLIAANEAVFHAREVFVS
jgi:hypothetical protein